MKHLRIFCLLALACFATITIAFAQAAKPAATPNAQAKKLSRLPSHQRLTSKSALWKENLSAPPKPCPMKSSISLPYR